MGQCGAKKMSRSGLDSYKYGGHEHIACDV
jgi:hypothetical protein